jgi:hypothetical protein
MALSGSLLSWPLPPGLWCSPSCARDSEDQQTATTKASAAVVKIIEVFFRESFLGRRRRAAAREHSTLGRPVSARGRGGVLARAPRGPAIS